MSSTRLRGTFTPLLAKNTSLKPLKYGWTKMCWNYFLIKLSFLELIKYAFRLSKCTIVDRYNSFIAAFISAICSYSSRVYPCADEVCSGSSFFHTFIIRRVYVTGNWSRKIVDLNLNRLKSIIFMQKTLFLRSRSLSASFLSSEVIDYVSSPPFRSSE